MVTKLKNKELKSIFQLAKQLYNANPWENLSPDQLIGTSYLHEGIHGYCSFTSGDELPLGFTMFTDSEGLLAYLTLASSEETIDSVRLHNLTVAQDGLVCSFVPQEELTTYDTELLSRAGIKLSPGDLGIIFRDLMPGKHPWYLETSYQCLFLQDVLEQLLFAINRIRTKGITPPSIQEKRAILSVTVDGEFDFMFVSKPLSTCLSLPNRPYIDNPFQLARIKKLPCNGQTLELFKMYFPDATPDQYGRPSLPVLMALIDPITLDAVHTHVFDDMDEYPEHYLQYLMQYWLQAGSKPYKLLVEDVNAYSSLKSLCESSKIQLELLSALPSVDQVIHQFTDLETADCLDPTLMKELEELLKSIDFNEFLKNHLDNKS